ncbi:MAG: transposase [Bacteroidota bacterium]|nr:transposase [Bacteroidota bacterium]
MLIQYRRFLPHIHPPGAALFLTMRLAGSLPQAVVDELLETPLDYRQQFVHFEAQLEAGGCGPIWLKQPAVAELVLSGLQRQHANGHYELLAACAMPNHLHLVLRLPDTADESFFRVMQRFKSATAIQANRLLGRSGRFWQHETFDHAIRESQPDALLKAIRYTAYNPVKARFCPHWQQWPGTFVAAEWHELLEPAP